MLTTARHQVLTDQQIFQVILTSSQLLLSFDSCLILRFEDPRWQVAACLPEKTASRPAVMAVQSEFGEGDLLSIPAGSVVLPVKGSPSSWFTLPLVRESSHPTLLMGQVNPADPPEILTEQKVWDTFAEQASLLLELVALRSQMASSLQREQRMSEMMRIITSEIELPLILQNVVQIAVEILDADCGVLGLVDPTGEWLEYAYLHNLPQVVNETLTAHGAGMAWRIIQSGQAVRIVDYSADPFALPEWVKTGIHAGVGAPVKAGEEHLGVLILFQREPQQIFPKEAEGFVETIGRQAGIAIQNARLFDRERRRADELEALRTTLTEMSAELELPRLLDSILRRAIQLTLASGGELGLVDPDKVYYRIVSQENIKSKRQQPELMPGQDILGKVVLSRQSLVINDYFNWQERSLELEIGLPITALAVPMFASGKLLGAISVISDQMGRVFNDDDMNLLTLFAQQAAIAIENARLYAEAQRLAITDSLTGLYNRRHFFHLARREVDRSIRYGQPLALIMLDIDRFKNINDTFGHLTGDLVLHEVAEFCARLLRDVDILTRYGGEEFAVLLPNTTAAGARLVARRLHESVENLQVEADDGIVQVTISLGVAQIGPDCTSLEDLLKGADQALYQAKAAGRNQVYVLG